MKHASPLSTASKFLFSAALRIRRLIRSLKCQAFGTLNINCQSKIGRIYVINLDRQPERWTEMEKELKYLQDYSGNRFWNLTERYSAVDAANLSVNFINDADIEPHYTLGDQLFVEPQPLALPTRVELDLPIQMSRPEIAVAKSHIGIWRQVVESNHEYVLILEDDVWFHTAFAKKMNQAWAEIMESNNWEGGDFDVLYLSYEEVKNGAPKEFLSSEIFQPLRGLWNLSGYVISRKGAEKLLQLLPCRGPIDLWLNHQFKFLNVCAIKQSIINQRPDFHSTNSYSILPSLTKIGAITSEGAALFHSRPSEYPVFVFGPIDSGLTSVGMALSMLGYRCCSDLETLPISEYKLLAGQGTPIFNAYVNIGSLASEARILKERYPQSKFILTTCNTSLISDDILILIDELHDIKVATVDKDATNKWQIICEHLRCAPPNCSFPELADIGQRKVISQMIKTDRLANFEIPKRDRSPWVIESHQSWVGIHCSSPKLEDEVNTTANHVDGCFKSLDSQNWFYREDTFTDNLALFRSSNIEPFSGGIGFSVKKEDLGVRGYSAAALTSNKKYLYGRFESTIKVSKVPGIITGFFLHRDSPRQEIDIEIAGNRTDRLLVNVFYNPGSDGAQFGYGYRGAATSIDLGFDASESYHQFAIEWEPNQIRWFVDNQLIHVRGDWDPTPIPHLPMSLHANIWPSRSRELAGRLVDRKLPTTTFIKSINVEANKVKP